MKLSWGAVLSSLYYSASAAAVGNVYLRDPSPKASPQAPSSVKPEIARLILAQRLGLSRFHSIKNSNEQAIQQINAFGGRPQKLFGGDDAESSKAQVLVWLDDVEDATELIKETSAFTISTPPGSADNDRLIQDMILQAKSIPKYPDPKARTYQALVDAESILSLKPTRHNGYLSIFHATKEDKFSRSELALQLARLLEEADKGDLSVTLVIMPPYASFTKRSLPYGTYGMPSIAESRQNAEALLSPGVPEIPEPSTSPNFGVSDLEDFPVVTQAQSDDGPVLGILPRCFDSLSDCEKTTKNCSSHGECKLLHKGKAGKSTDCFSCACVPTIKESHPGMENTKKQVTYWGGPACQKMDVSVPFWLFVGSGVLLAFLISSGIGLLYSVGSEELPSVIGAGVSGPVRK